MLGDEGMTVEAVVMYRLAVLIGLYDGVFGEDARGGAIFVTGADCFGLIGNR